MARIRSIKPEFWEDEKLASALPRDVRLLYIALWNHTDESSRMQGDPRFVKGKCFPYDDDVTADVIEGWLTQLEGCGRVVRYTIDGSRYLFLPKLGNHQKLDPRLKPRHPAPPAETPTTPIHTDMSGRNTEPSEHVDASARAHTPALQVAGGREQVAGSGGGEAANDDTTRPDVDRLCTHLADRIESNCVKRPPITKRWRETARLMLDRDGHTEDQIHKAIDWCQDDEFWRSNVLSMRKLREKYDQLRLQAQRARASPTNSRQQETDEMFTRAMERAQAREAEV